MSPLVPYLVVRDARAALQWYAEALGARTVEELVSDDGRIGHAELDVAGATLYLADEHPELGLSRRHRGRRGGGRTAGGQVGDIERTSYGLSALCRDDQGLPFWLGQLG